MLRTVGIALPPGQYRAMLLELAPVLVQPWGAADYFTHEQVELWGIDSFWNLPHDPRRVLPLRLGGARERPPTLRVCRTDESNWLDGETTAGYEKRLQAGERPTALAISVLDVKQPADWEGDPAVTEHWCLAHYLLDGHHKPLAAARAQRPLRLLSFLATGKSIATEEDIERAIDALTPSAADGAPSRERLVICLPVPGSGTVGAVSSTQRQLGQQPFGATVGELGTAEFSVWTVELDA